MMATGGGEAAAGYIMAETERLGRGWEEAESRENMPL
jgi:hypothetical protein